METCSHTTATLCTAPVQLGSYLLVAPVDTATGSLIWDELSYFSARYRNADTIRHTPAIAIAQFMIKEEMEPTILRWMHRIISAQQQFSVTLTQFAGKASQSIYLRVQDHQPFQQLTKGLKTVEPYVKSYDCPDMQWVMHPYIPLLQQVAESQYETLLSDLQERNFQTSFKVQELILFRKDTPVSKQQQVHVFGLRP